MGMSGRQARRLMERMGMRMEELSNVVQVIIRTSTREITITQPTVTLTRMQGQNIYQVMGGEEALEVRAVAVRPAEGGDRP